jgi:predicted kinase
MMTIVVSGPPATGKTTLALAVGRALGSRFSRDPLMEVLFDGRLGWPRLLGGWVPGTGLRIQTVLLARQLELGQSTVLECVAPPTMRQLWREMTVQAGHRFLSVECVCSDTTTHRARFEQRRRQAQPRAFARRRATTATRGYRPDEHPDFVADAVRPVAALVPDIVRLIRPGT